MKIEDYRQFTAQLQKNLNDDPDVLGLVAVGSMAEQDYQPDDWSDHDFFVIVNPGKQEKFRNEISWLPEPDHVVFFFRETSHGVKALYDHGHLLEYAIFDPEELRLAKVNRYRILQDRSNLQLRMQEIVSDTRQQGHRNTYDDLWLIGQFLTQMLVAAGRYRRGEELSGYFFMMSGLRHLILLFSKHLKSGKETLKDEIDPVRRFESLYPELGKEINKLMRSSIPQTAAGLLRIAARELMPHIREFPANAIQTVLLRIEG
jgi:hypothetical protein